VAEVIKHRKYVKVDVDANNNKYWKIWEYDDNSIAVEWGRVGAPNPQSKTYPPYHKNFMSLCASKEKKGYREAQVLDGTAGTTGTQTVTNIELKTVVAEQIAATNPIVKKLMDRLIANNVHNIVSRTNITYNAATGTFATPLGVITQKGIDTGRNLLYNISQANLTDRNTRQLVNDYLMIIPQETNTRTNPITIFEMADAIARQSDILDSLQASLDQIASGQIAQQQTAKIKTPSIFNVQLTLVEDGKIIDWIKRKYTETKQNMHAAHKLNVNKVFAVNIAGMSDAFVNDGGKMENVWALWHGTRISNVLSILAKGLMIPNATASHCTGRMFGNGIYTTDQSTKALNYSYGYWGNNSRDNNCFMFMCKVAMGKYYVPRTSYESLPKTGFDSTYAQANKSGVINNEMIVYRTSQVDLQYLVEFN